MARRKIRRPPSVGGPNDRHWWNHNVPRREVWPENEREARKANMAMVRAIGVGLILSICGGLGSSWITTQAKLTELELKVAVLESRLLNFLAGRK